ncbi:MAG: hypothetical protein NZ606_06745 [Candidatus Kapabacteria bacterium]|nr:hypothetical protein [Candidatus Kapabacteria bacterium]MCX7937688.1 hypothetical protein [Chlorobiota bacterium]
MEASYGGSNHAPAAGGYTLYLCKNNPYTTSIKQARSVSFIRRVTQMAAASRGSRTRQVGRAGEYFVVAELNKRGAFAIPSAGNIPGIDIIACNSDRSRTVYIQVKTKRRGKNWHSTIAGCRPTPPNPDEHNFWVFVDLGEIGEPPRYWVVPEWWINDNIYWAHQEYLRRHGGVRPGNPDSLHHSIDESRLEEWKDRWDVLGIVE